MSQVRSGEVTGVSLEKHLRRVHFISSLVCERVEMLRRRRCSHNRHSSDTVFYSDWEASSFDRSRLKLESPTSRSSESKERVLHDTSVFCLRVRMNMNMSNLPSHSCFPAGCDLLRLRAKASAPENMSADLHELISLSKVILEFACWLKTMLIRIN